MTKDSKPEIILVLDNIRSLHNVGSILRTAEGFGVRKVIAVGITPYTTQKSDKRLPHVAKRAQSQIAKTALGAERSVEMSTTELEELPKLVEGYELVALEQSSSSINIRQYNQSGPIALVLGNEPNGVSNELLEHCETHLEIPMHGSKESFNVSVATGIALYALTA